MSFLSDELSFLRDENLPKMGMSFPGVNYPQTGGRDQVLLSQKTQAELDTKGLGLRVQVPFEALLWQPVAIVRDVFCMN